MTEGYTGWKLFDKVTIVAKRMCVYDYKTHSSSDTGNLQGYLVDPSNKKQLENARKWGTVTTWEYFTDENGNRSIGDKLEYKPEEYTYDNDGFTLELHNSAGGSSQGGKLSFWNCWITAPDGHRFLIGIAADLLLDVLKSSTVVNGIVQDKLMFARCNGGVGMLSKSMDSYKNAVNDMSVKKQMTKGKTSKHVVGHVYETLTEANVYGGKFYRWYEPIVEESTSWYGYKKRIVGFRKLEKPIEFIYFPRYDAEKTKLSDYQNYWWYTREKAPARREANVTVEVDITPEELCDKFNDYNIFSRYEVWKKDNRYSHNILEDVVGVSPNNIEYTMPENLRSVLTELKYKIED